MVFRCLQFLTNRWQVKILLPWLSCSCFEEPWIDEIVVQLQYVKTKVENGIVIAFYQVTWRGVTNEEVLNIMLNYNIFLKNNNDTDILSRYRGYFTLVCLSGSKVFVPNPRVSY